MFKGYAQAVNYILSATDSKFKKTYLNIVTKLKRTRNNGTNEETCINTLIYNVKLDTDYDDNGVIIFPEFYIPVVPGISKIYPVVSIFEKLACQLIHHNILQLKQKLWFKMMCQITLKLFFRM